MKTLEKKSVYILKKRKEFLELCNLCAWRVKYKNLRPSRQYICDKRLFPGNIFR